MAEVHSQDLEEPSETCSQPSSETPWENLQSVLSTLFILLVLLFIVMLGIYAQIDTKPDSIRAMLRFDIDTANTPTLDGKFCFMGAHFNAAYSTSYQYILDTVDHPLMNNTGLPQCFQEGEQIIFRPDFTEEMNRLNPAYAKFVVVVRNIFNNAVILDVYFELKVNMRHLVDGFSLPRRSLVTKDLHKELTANSLVLIARNEELCEAITLLHANDLSGSILLCFTDYSDGQETV